MQGRGVRITTSGIFSRAKHHGSPGNPREGARRRPPWPTLRRDRNDCRPALHPAVRAMLAARAFCPIARNRRSIASRCLANTSTINRDVLVVLLRHLHRSDTGLGANVGATRTTSKLMVLVELLNLTFDREPHGRRDSNVKFAPLGTVAWSTRPAPALFVRNILG